MTQDQKFTPSQMPESNDQLSNALEAASETQLFVRLWRAAGGRGEIIKINVLGRIGGSELYK